MVDIDSQLTQQQEEPQEQTQSSTLDVFINDHLKLSIFCTLLFLFCGGWPSLICSIPAIYFAASVSMIC